MPIVISENYKVTNKEKDKKGGGGMDIGKTRVKPCLLYTSPSPRDGLLSRMPSSA